MKKHHCEHLVNTLGTTEEDVDKTTKASAAELQTHSVEAENAAPKN